MEIYLRRIDELVAGVEVSNYINKTKQLINRLPFLSTSDLEVELDKCHKLQEELDDLDVDVLWVVIEAIRESIINSIQDRDPAQRWGKIYLSIRYPCEDTADEDLLLHAVRARLDGFVPYIDWLVIKSQFNKHVDRVVWNRDHAFSNKAFDIWDRRYTMIMELKEAVSKH